jgi:hypothetical protein
MQTISNARGNRSCFDQNLSTLLKFVSIICKVRLTCSFYLNPVAQVPKWSGTFMSVSGLNPSKFTCRRVFNLFCAYGDVMKVRDVLDMDVELNSSEYINNLVIYSRNGNLQGEVQEERQGRCRCSNEIKESR